MLCLDVKSLLQVATGHRAFPSVHILQVFLGVNVETTASREPGTATFHWAHKRLRAQVGYAVAFQMFSPL